MEQKSNFWKSAALYGLYVGIVITLFSVILYVTGQTTNKVLGYLSVPIYFGCVFWAQIQYRNTNLNGEISYGQALGFGVATMLFSGVISMIYTLIIYNVDPSLIEQIKAVQEQALLAKGMSEDQVETSMKIAERFMSPSIMAISGIIGSAFIGTIISLITSFFVKRQMNEDAFDEAMEEVKNEEEK